MLMSKEQMDMANGDDDALRQWEPEPPPEGGYEVVRIYPYGEGAEDFVETTTEMARHEPDIAAISAEGVGFPLDKEEITSVQLGGLSHDGQGNLILERRERRKEVVEEEKAARADAFRKRVADLVDSLERIATAGEDAAEQAESE